jgi:putative oxidoreductase
MKAIFTNQHLGIFLFRIYLCLQILYGVLDNIVSWDRMLEFRNFLQSEGFPFPLSSAILSVYGQFFAAVFLLIGYKSRWAAAVLVINFMVAAGVHVANHDPLPALFPALNILFGAVLFLFNGAGRFANKPGLSLLKEKNK